MLAKGLGVAMLIAALSAVGYFGNEALTCNRLEEYYLNSVASIRSAELTGALINNAELDELMNKQRQLYNVRVEQAAKELYTKCGERRWNTAQRRAYDMVLDW